MKTKVVILAVLIAVAGAVLAKMAIDRNRRQRDADARDFAAQKARRTAELERLAAEKPRETGSTTPSAPTESGRANAPETKPTVVENRAVPTPQPVAPPVVPTTPGRRELQDPLAKVALAMVGADADAEVYWLDAIYDSNLPDPEREDLMEDLNEDGLSDPRHPGPGDLPLIMNRLRLIEQVVPTADSFMLTHLWEAYKDLWNLAEVAQGRGQPVN
jgi:hypothetical protein